MASETATAQQIKSQYASLRLKRMQTEVAQFCSELLRIKAQLMCDLYSPESLKQMSGIMGTDDAAYADEAIALIKQEPARSFRIEVAADSLVEMDEIGEKQSRTEFMTAFGAVLRDAVPMVQAAPEMGALVGEVLQFVVRTFKGGRQLENVLETTIAKMNEPKEEKPAPPDPEQIKAEAAMQLEQMKAQTTMQLEQSKQSAMAQTEQFKAQENQTLEAARLQNALQIEQMRLAAETEREAMRMAHDRDMEIIRQQGENERAKVTAIIGAETKIAEMESNDADIRDQM